MLYVMIGMVCSAIGCQWVPAFDDESFTTEKACIERAQVLQPRSVMYFQMKCKPVSPGSQS